MPRGSTDKVGRVCVTSPIDGPTAAESDLTLRSRVVDVLGEEERKKKKEFLILWYGLWKYYWSGGKGVVFLLSS